MKHKLFPYLFFFIFALASASCSAKSPIPKRLLGKWYMAPASSNITTQFYEDGTYVSYYPQYHAETRGKFEITGEGTMTISILETDNPPETPRLGHVMKATFEILGDRLMINENLDKDAWSKIYYFQPTK